MDFNNYFLRSLIYWIVISNSSVFSFIRVGEIEWNQGLGRGHR
jgi:hypothetical protein